MSEESRARAGEQAEALRRLGKELDRVRRALQALSREETWGDRSLRRKSLADLSLLEGLSLPELSGLRTELEAGVRERLREHRAAFLDALFQGASERELSLAQLGDQPPVFDLGGLTLTLDFDREEARFSYARETAGRTPLEVAAILETRHSVLEGLAGAWPGAGPFFQALLSAYRARLGREGGRMGERVPLVDLVPELGIEYERRGLARDRREERPFGRLELAFCLDRLAREGGLQQEGTRLELGTATGGSTKDKKRVLFLEAGMGGGQYYLSLRFVPLNGGG